MNHGVSHQSLSYGNLEKTCLLESPPKSIYEKCISLEILVEVDVPLPFTKKKGNQRQTTGRHDDHE